MQFNFPPYNIILGGGGGEGVIIYNVTTKLNIQWMGISHYIPMLRFIQGWSLRLVTDEAVPVFY